MKPEPLKGNYDGIYFKEDIRLAVEWLKKEIRINYPKTHDGGLVPEVVDKVIDQAFEDVVKNIKEKEHD